jgi:hypothetical protein
MYPFDRDTVWLSLVNIGLGVVCAFFLVLVARAIIRDLAERAESNATGAAGRQCSVGFTLADGGEPLSAQPEAGSDSSHSPRRSKLSYLKRTIL